MFRTILTSMCLSCISSSLAQVTTVNSLNLEEYAGRWYQVLYLSDHKEEAAAKDIKSLNYSINASLVSPFLDDIKDNETMYMYESFRRYNPHGHNIVMNGHIIQPNVATPGAMQMKLKTMPYATPYLVMKLGPIDPNTNLYQYSIVTDINKGTLFIYARDIDRFHRDFKEEALKFCRENGFTNYDNEPKETPQPPPCDYKWLKCSEGKKDEIFPEEEQLVTL